MITEYTAEWYESDEYDQWLAMEAFDTLEAAQQAAFKNTIRKFTHGICYVTVRELRDLDYGPDWVTVQELVNHHDGPRWSGWITRDKYEC